MSDLWGGPRSEQSKWGFVSSQLAGVDASKRISDAVTALLKTIDDVTAQYDLTDDELRDVMQYLRELQLGHALVAVSEDERWGDVIPGEYRIGDTVRVRSDAYTGELGRQHNGKRGRVTGSRNGSAVVLYDDSPSADYQFHHLPGTLQRLL